MKTPLDIEREALEEDRKMLDFLDQNIFAGEPDEWDRKYGRCKDGDTAVWNIFAPKGAHGSARNIIRAAMKEADER